MTGGVRRYSAAVHQAFAAVRRALDGLALQPFDTVLVACSGGADSLALAVALAQAAKNVGRSTRAKGFPIQAGAVIVDHQLQPDSAEVAAATAETCRKLGLTPVIVKAVHVTGAGGPEAAARAARYQAFTEAAHQTGAKAILLGHTLDDQAEQVLLGLARGSGARSLAGMAPRRAAQSVAQPCADSSGNCVVGQNSQESRDNQDNAIEQDKADKPIEQDKADKRSQIFGGSEFVYLRPLLSVRRKTTEEICQLFNLTPWHDPTNQLEFHQTAQPTECDIVGKITSNNPSDNKSGTDISSYENAPTRTRIRADALPALERAAGPGVAEALARTAEMLREDADALDFFAESVLAEAQTATGINVATIAKAPKAVRTRAIRRALLAAGVAPDAASRALVLAVAALVSDWHGQGGVNLPGNLVARRIGGILTIDSAMTQKHG